MDCSPSGSSVHGISQARILKWIAIPFSGIFLTQGSLALTGRFFTSEPSGKPLLLYNKSLLKWDCITSDSCDPMDYSSPQVVAQMVKNVPAVWETWVRSLGWEDPLEEGMATHSSILAWRIHMGDPQGSLAGYSPWGHKDSDITEQLNTTEMREREWVWHSYATNLEWMTKSNLADANLTFALPFLGYRTDFLAEHMIVWNKEYFSPSATVKYQYGT